MAVAGLVQRSTFVQDENKHAVAVRLTVGTDIGLPLAQRAQAVAAGGVTDAELRRLRADALGDSTISDAERMVLAALPAGGQDQLEAAMRAHHTQLTRALQKSVQAHYGTQDSPGGNELPADALRGESRLHWIDRL